MPLPYRFLARLIGKSEPFADAWIHDGLEGLTHKNVAKMWDDISKTYPEAKAAISNKVFYIQSWQEASRVAAILQTGAWYLKLTTARTTER